VATTAVAAPAPPRRPLPKVLRPTKLILIRYHDRALGALDFSAKQFPLARPGVCVGLSATRTRSGIETIWNKAQGGGEHRPLSGPRPNRSIVPRFISRGHTWKVACTRPTLRTDEPSEPHMHCYAAASRRPLVSLQHWR
jgi:hypothetical protein